MTPEQQIEEIARLQSLERQVMSKILNNNNLYIENASLFKIRLFRNDTICRDIFPLFEEIVSSGGKPDVVQLSERLNNSSALNDIVELYSCNNYNIDFMQAVEMLRDNIIYNEIRQLIFVHENWDGLS